MIHNIRNVLTRRRFVNSFFRTFSDHSKVTENLTTAGPNVGSYAEVERIFSQSTVNQFAAISGDNNPIHINPEYALTTRFKGTIVHGILVSSLFSMLLGSLIRGCIYVSQSLSFKRPVHVGATVVARIEVINAEKTKTGTLITCSTKAFLPLNENQIVIVGEAKALVPY
jgi:acyl dehydratase